MKRWQKSRWQELDDLRDLLFGLSNLQDETRALDKLARLMAIAGKLAKSKCRDHRVSFLRFVEQIAEAAEKDNRKKVGV